MPSSYSDSSESLNGHFAEKFVKNIVPSQSYHGYRVAIWLSLVVPCW